MEKLGLAFWFPKVGQDPFFFVGSQYGFTMFQAMHAVQSKVTWPKYCWMEYFQGGRLGYVLLMDKIQHHLIPINTCPMQYAVSLSPQMVRRILLNEQ